MLPYQLYKSKQILSGNWEYRQRKFGGNRDYGFKINGYYVFCCKNPTVRREQKRCYEKQSRITIDTMRSETALKSSYIENNTIKKLNFKIKVKKIQLRMHGYI